MAVKQNAIDHAHEYSLAAEVVKSFYVDDWLSGVANTELAMMLRQQLRPGATSTAGMAMAIPLFVPIIQGASDFLQQRTWTIVAATLLALVIIISISIKHTPLVSSTPIR